MNNKRERILGIVKYVLGLLGFIGIVVAILTVTNLLDTLMLNLGYKKLNDNQKLIISLSSSIIGILFLFIAFSRQIDKFFQVLETTEFRKKTSNKGITAESLFFSVVAVILIVLALLLGIDVLTLEANVPFLGGATEIILIIALVLLALFSIFTAFNETIIYSIKEMRKVTWPTGKQMVDFSLKVFSFIIFFSLLFVALDLPIGYLIDLVLPK